MWLIPKDPAVLAVARESARLAEAKEGPEAAKGTSSSSKIAAFVRNKCTCILTLDIFWFTGSG